MQLLERAKKGEYNLLFAHIQLSATYIEFGQEEKARAQAAEVLRIYPKFSLQWWKEFLPYKNKTDTERYLSSLRKAGLE